MPRTVRNPKLDTRSARSKLRARKSVYWTSISPGCALGYRKGAKGGTWVAKFAGSGQRRERTIGPADDVMDPDGVAALSFAQAQERARAWFGQTAREAAGEEAAGPYTVASAMRDYVQWFQDERFKTVNDKRYMASAFILPELGDTEVTRLRARTIRDWHRSIAATAPRLRTRPGDEQKHRDTSGDPHAQRRRQATANRVLSTLKAALNLAWREGKVPSDHAWRRVKPFPELDAARTRYLSTDECSRLANACEPDLRRLVQAALYTGCRYQELARMRAADFNADGGTALVLESKSGRSRHVVLTAEGRSFFETLTAGRAGTELIFQKSGGAAWARSHQRRPFREACQRAGIDPPASFHTLRHTYASLFVMGGAPLAVVARNLGHADTRMVEKHYAHLAPGYVADEIRAAAPDFGFDDAANVATLRPRAPAPEIRQRRAR